MEKDTVEFIVLQSIQLEEDIWQVIASNDIPRKSLAKPKIDSLWHSFEESGIERNCIFQDQDKELFERIIGFRYFPIRHSRRISNFQRLDDVKIPYFWSGYSYILTQRSHHLIWDINNQFLLLFRFKLERDLNCKENQPHSAFKNSADNLILNLIGTRKWSYECIGQGKYSSQIINQAVNEVGTTIALIDASGKLSREKSEKDLAKKLAHSCFPILIGNSLDEDSLKIFGNQVPSKLEVYPLSSKKFSGIYLGWTFSLVAGQESAALKDVILIHTFMQCAYDLVRQYQNTLIKNMYQTSEEKIKNQLLEDAYSFHFLTLAYQRFTLYYDRFVWSLQKDQSELLKNLEIKWDMKRSFDALKNSFEFTKNFQLEQYNYNASISANRQQAVLFFIAVIQLLALVSVFSDYLNLFSDKLLEEIGFRIFDDINEPSTIEILIARYSISIIRALVFISISLPFLYFDLHGKILRILRLFFIRGSQKIENINSMSKVRLNLIKFRSNHLKQLKKAYLDFFNSLRFKKILGKRSSLGSSAVHGTGLFARTFIRDNEEIFHVHLGTPYTFDEYRRKSGKASEEWSGEWNIVNDNLMFYRERKTPYRFINHSREPNAVISVNKAKKLLELKASRNIYKGEEIRINYMNEPLPQDYIINRGGYL